MSNNAPLAVATRDLHHAVEQTPLGQAMANGTVTEDQYAAWLETMLTVHRVIDPYLPKPTWRCAQLRGDLVALGYNFHRPDHITELVRHPCPLWSAEEAAGACYVMIGAHLMGGRIIAEKTRPRLPALHVTMWPDKRAAGDYWRMLRDQEQLIEPAKECFAFLLHHAELIGANHRRSEYAPQSVE